MSEEYKQRLKEIEAYSKLDSEAAKFPYYCKECKAEFWMSFLDIMRQTDPPHLMPCGHDFSKLDFIKSTWEAYKINNPLPEVSDE